jgi:hypothetical protein
MTQNSRLAKTVTDQVATFDRPSREIADIKRVVAILQEQHPELEVWHPDLDFPRKKRPSPAWVAIGGVWVATLVSTGLAAAGVAFLLR